MKITILSPFNYTTDSMGEGGNTYAYELTAPLELRIEGMAAHRAIIYAGSTTIGLIKGDTLRISNGYAWNGMSCWPDSPRNVIASCVHDFGYQLGRSPNNPLTRQQWDAALAAILRARGDTYHRAIYAAVRLAGWKFYGNGKNINLRPLES